MLYFFITSKVTLIPSAVRPHQHDPSPDAVLARFKLHEALADSRLTLPFRSQFLTCFYLFSKKLANLPLAKDSASESRTKLASVMPCAACLRDFESKGRDKKKPHEHMRQRLLKSYQKVTEKLLALHLQSFNKAICSPFTFTEHPRLFRRFVGSPGPLIQGTKGLAPVILVPVVLFLLLVVI